MHAAETGAAGVEAADDREAIDIYREHVFKIVFIILVPFIILAALSPAIAMLIKRGLAGKFAGAVIAWYLFTSFAAGLVGVIVSATVFRIGLTSGTSGIGDEALRMIATFRGQTGASGPLLAIAGALAIGIASI